MGAWTRADLGDAGMRDVEATDSDGSGGAVFERDGDGWNRDETPTGADLKAVVRGSTDVAVDATGTILESR